MPDDENGWRMLRERSDLRSDCGLIAGALAHGFQCLIEGPRKGVFVYERSAPNSYCGYRAKILFEATDSPKLRQTIQWMVGRDFDPLELSFHFEGGRSVSQWCGEVFEIEISQKQGWSQFAFRLVGYLLVGALDEFAGSSAR